MTKEAVIYQFWSGFGLPAFEENSVPSGEYAPKFPYITYQLSTDSFGNSVSLSASIWDRNAEGHSAGKSNNAKAKEISEYIGLGGRKLACDEGAIWIKRGSPFAQTMGDPSDDMINRKYINITAEFLTAD